MEVEQPYLRGLLTMVINHLLTGMNLQVKVRNIDYRVPKWITGWWFAMIFFEFSTLVSWGRCSPIFDVSIFFQGVGWNHQRDKFPSVEHRCCMILFMCMYVWYTCSDSTDSNEAWTKWSVLLRLPHKCTWSTILLKWRFLYGIGPHNTYKAGSFGIEVIISAELRNQQPPISYNII